MSGNVLLKKMVVVMTNVCIYKPLIDKLKCNFDVNIEAQKQIKRRRKLEIEH